MSEIKSNNSVVTNAVAWKAATDKMSVVNANSKEYEAAIKYLKDEVAKAAKSVVSSMDKLSHVTSVFCEKAHEAEEAGATNPIIRHAISDLMEFEQSSNSLRRLAFRL